MSANRAPGWKQYPQHRITTRLAGVRVQVKVKGELVADTRADVMKAGIGVAVRRGAPRPDIATVDAFQRTLLAAKSITYLKEGASTIYLDRLSARMGIADALAAEGPAE